MQLTDNITEIKGIGEKTALLFSKASVFSVYEIINYFPRDYIELPEVVKISEIVKGRTNAVEGKVCSSVSLFSNRGKSILSFDINDGSGIIKVYYFNMPFLRNSIKPGMTILVYGTIGYEAKGFSNPKMTSREEYEKLRGKLIPVYPLVKGLTSAKIVTAVAKVMQHISADELEDYLPENIRKREGLIGLYDAIKLMHFPGSMEEVFTARKRLAFDEFFTFLYKMKILSGDTKKSITNIVMNNTSGIDEFIDSLPYKLTNGQLQAIKEISEDLSSGYQMNRLVQGDVGCGKTIVAIIASLQAAINGYQAALMAPTVVLASQHFEDALNLAGLYGIDIRPVLLTGSMKAAERRTALAGIKDGSFNLIIGTHALITDKVEYNNLGLAICDEQHRFGVKQRFNLSDKGDMVHQLVMSATPIPRTLGLILYGDLDVSTIKEKPANRLPLKNAVVGPEFRPRNYKFMLDEINKGHQVYIICPMVEEGEADTLKNVETYPDEIRQYFPPSVRIASLHGKMKSADKDKITSAFKNHEYDILVSTTVVEVGVNVPNATVIMIENAERFGLAGLHQLRGRVGRGDAQSYAIFVTENSSEKNMKRLGLLAKTNDGFEIASEDLKLRGPGDFFGYRQSGDPMFKMADLYTDADILKSAKYTLDNLFDNAGNTDNDALISSFEYYLKKFDRGYICL